MDHKLSPKSTYTIQCFNKIVHREECDHERLHLQWRSNSEISKYNKTQHTSIPGGQQNWEGSNQRVR